MGRQKLPFPLFFSFRRPIYRGRIVSANHPIKCLRGRFITRIFAGKRGERSADGPPTHSRTMCCPDDDAPGRLLTMKYRAVLSTKPMNYRRALASQAEVQSSFLPSMAQTDVLRYSHNAFHIVHRGQHPHSPSGKRAVSDRRVDAPA